LGGWKEKKTLNTELGRPVFISKCPRNVDFISAIYLTYKIVGIDDLDIYKS
jgi:hypothetical protein